MKEELLKKANEILEKTKNEQEKYEAENGSLFGGAAPADAAGNIAQSGRRRVGWVQSAQSGVDIQVTVPQNGYYKYDMV